MKTDKATIEYRGWLVAAPWGEAYDILYLTADRAHLEDDPLASVIEHDMWRYGQYLSVHYHIADVEQTTEQFDEALAHMLVGYTKADVGHHYSEITGYLWTDEKIQVGGHDLISGLHSYLGKYCQLTITYAREKP